MDLVPYILLDSSVLTNGMRVLVEGVDTAQFEKNPVMFYVHEDYTLPLGRWVNIRKENGMLLADAEFDEDDDDVYVKRILKKVKKGYIKMVSPGLVDLELSDDPVYRIEGQSDYTVVRCRIREASIVPIGRNHNALRLFDKQGKEISLSDPDCGLRLSDFIVKQKIQEKMSKKYLQILNLSDDASDEMVERAVEKLSADKAASDAKVAAYEKKEADQRKAEALNLTDTAIRDGRINANAKEQVLNLFDKDFEGAKATLAAIPVPAKIKDLNLGDQTSEQKVLEAMNWDQLDKSGKVLLCKDSYPELYKAKFKEKFGKEPKMD